MRGVLPGESTQTTLASRICAAADAGHILTSDVIQELGRTKGFSFGQGQEQTLKGFATATRLFELVGGVPH